MNKFGLDLVESGADEDFFGTLRSRSTLDQLFGVDSIGGSNSSNTDDNQTLKYQPVKQSEHQNAATKATAEAPTASWQTQLVKVAIAYRVGEAVGKVGVALLHNGTDAWQMILYKSKTQVLSTVSLLPQSAVAAGRELHLQSRYLQYYDNSNVYWSLLFDKQTDEREFLDKLQAIGVSVQQQPEEEQKQVQQQQQQKEEEHIAPVIVQPDYKEVLPSMKTNTAEPTASSNVQVNDNSKAKHSKTALITRMAKMGQQLPKYTAAAKTTTTTDYSDSSDTEVLATPGALNAAHHLQNKPIIMPRNQRNVQQPTLATTDIVPMATAPTTVSTNVGLYNGGVAAMETQFMQMLLTENRTQNTEMRMNMNKLEGKLEKVLDKMDCLHGGKDQLASKEDEMLELEEKLLELKKENRKLKQGIENRTLRNTRSNDDDENDLKARIVQLHRNNLDALGLSATANLSTLIGDLVERIHTLQASVQESVEKVTAVEQRSKHNEEQLKAENVRHNQIAQQQCEELQSQLDKLQEMLKSQEQQNTQLAQTLVEEQQHFSEQLNEERKKTTATVKAIMNALYANVATKLEALNEPHADTILALVGKTIREETLKAITEQQKQQ